MLPVSRQARRACSGPGGRSLGSLVPAVHPVRSVALIAVLVLVGACSGDEQADPPAPPAPPVSASAELPAGEEAPEGIDGVVAVDGLTNEHTEEPVDYPSSPPLGGDHFPAWLNCGYYDRPVPDEAAVHSLEHGAVWITFRPDSGPDDLTHLEDLAASDGHVLVSPYPELRSPFVLTAWGRQLDLETLDDPRLEEFLEEFLRAGEAPEPGAACTGGLDL